MLQGQEHAARQCLLVAWVTSQWPQVETCGSSAHEPEQEECPVSPRPWEG